MCGKRRNADYFTHLSADGWVEFYDPYPRRQGYAGEGTPENEFRQSIPMYTPRNEETFRDENKPWLGIED